MWSNGSKLERKKEAEKEEEIPLMEMKRRVPDTYHEGRKDEKQASFRRDNDRARELALGNTITELTDQYRCIFFEEYHNSMTAPHRDNRRRSEILTSVSARSYLETLVSLMGSNITADVMDGRLQEANIHCVRNGYNDMSSFICNFSNKPEIKLILHAVEIRRYIDTLNRYKKIFNDGFHADSLKRQDIEEKKLPQKEKLTLNELRIKVNQAKTLPEITTILIATGKALQQQVPDKVPIGKKGNDSDSSWCSFFSSSEPETTGYLLLSCIRSVLDEARYQKCISPDIRLDTPHVPGEQWSPILRP